MGPFKINFFKEGDATDDQSATTSNSSHTHPMSNVTEVVTHINANSRAPETITDLVNTRTRSELVDVKLILHNRGLVRSLLRGWAVEINQYDHLSHLIATETCVQEAKRAILRITKPVDVDAALDQNLVRTVISIPVDGSLNRTEIEPRLPEEDSYISEELKPQYTTKIGEEEHQGYDRIEV